MNVSSGGLSFDFTATNENLVRIVEQSKKEIQGLADASKAGGAQMDAAFKQAANRLDAHAQKINKTMSDNREAMIKLEKEMASLKAQATDAFAKGDFDANHAATEAYKAKERELQSRQKVTQACYEALDVLDQEHARMEKMRTDAEQAAKAKASLRSQLRQVTNELSQLKSAQADGTADDAMIARMRELEAEAGRITDAIGDAKQAARVLADDNANITGVITGINGLAGAFSAAQGAMSFFGAENEEVQQAMLKVQSALAVTTGLQQVANALNKDSAFILVTVRKAKELLAAAELKLAAALGASTAAAKALMATLTLGLSVAITAIIAAIEYLETASTEAAAFNKKVAETAAEPISKVELLAAKWSALGNDINAKRRFVDENKKSFDELGVSIRDVAEAENLLITNKDAFIAAQIEKAKAAAYIEAQKDNIEDLVELEQKLAQQEERRSTAKLSKKGMRWLDEEIDNTKKKIDKLRKTIREGYKGAADAQDEALGIMADAQLKATQDGQEAADAFTDYVKNGTLQAEQNLGTFGSKVRGFYNNLLNDLQNSSNIFANAFGRLLGGLFGDPKELEGADGTVGDRLDRVKKKYDDAVKHLADLRKRNSTATAADIEEAQKNVDKYATLYKTLSGVSITPTGGGGGGSKKKTEAEKFAEELSQKKALYQKYIAWATSSDATVREAAATEFAPLLESGKTYLAFLEQQRDSISQKATKTATDLQKLQMLNNEIAEATKDTVIKDFQTQLETDLQACTTLGAMLDLIEQRRQAIAGDDTEVGNQKRDILDDAEDDTKKQIKSETAQLLSTYASFEAERLKFLADYARNRQLLERRIAEASTDAERQAAQAALDALNEKNDYYTKATTATYAALLEEYKTHQQKLAEIQANYAKQRAEAEANGNISMVQMINQKEQEEISKLAATQLMASDSWNKLFTDMERLGTTTIARLIKEVEANKVTLSAQLNPADLKAVNDQLERARQELQQRNPFLALRNSLAELRQSMAEQKLLSDDNDPILAELKKKQETYNTIAEQMAKPANPVMAAAIPVIFKDTLSGGADFTDYLKKRIDKLQKEKVKLGVEFTGQHELDVLIAMLNKVQGTGKSVGQGLKDSFSDAASSIQFISGCFDAVVGGMKKMGISMDEETEAILGDIGGIMEGAQNVAQGIATGNPLSVIQGSITLFSSAFDLFNSRDRKAEKSIKRHEEALGRLKNAYNELEHAVNKALGEEVYRNQSSLIGNLRKQQAELTGMITDEQSKKHTDKSRIEEWQEQYAELGRQISDIIDEITQSITQTSAKDLAGGIADALIEAFEGGEDAAKAFGEVADDVIKKAVVNALKLQMLERPLQNAIKQLQRDMGFDEEGNGFFNGLSETERKRFKDAVEAAGANFQLAMDAYKDLFGQLDDSDPTTLSGAIKGASQESIDLLAGQTNAVRQNQVTQLALFRQQLIHVSNIDANVGVIAGRLLSILNALTSPAGTSLRSQGITD